MKMHPIYCLALALITLSCGVAEKHHGEEKAHEPDTPVETAKSGGYNLVSADTDLRFVIVSNSAGPITARFPSGVSGTLDADGKGTVNIQLDTMKSLDQNDLENPLRDANVLEAFFGVRPSAIFPEPVDKAWELLADKLDRSVQEARFEITGAEGLSGDGAEGSLKGNLMLWNKISIPLSFPVTITRAENRIELASSSAVSFDLEEVLGSDLRKLAFDTMLAAGCAHQPGIQNKVEITLDRVVLAQQ